MDRPKEELCVLAGSGSPKFGRSICRHLGIDLARSEAMHFSDGNTFVRVLENVRGRDVFVVQTMSPPVDRGFMELLFWIDALKRASAAEVTAVIPYFSYAKGDKKDEPRVSIRARVCADCLEAAGVDRVLTMDLHAPQIQGFFRVPVDHLYAAPVLMDEVKKLNGDDNWVVVSPDAGFAKTARTYAKLMGASFALAEKIRPDHSEQPVVEYIIGKVEGKRALIVDDFTTSGGTIIAAAERLRQKGAREVYAAVAHGALSPEAIERVRTSPLKQLYISDTVEHDPSSLHDKITVVSVAGLFADAIQSVFNRTSVSRLFPDPV